MAISLLVGPSGVGKTTACGIVAKESSIKVIDLDEFLRQKIGVKSLSAHLAEVGDEQFFTLSKEGIEEIEKDASSDLIIVVGAGSINLPVSHSWYQSKNLLALVGDPQVIYERGNRQKHHPSISGFIKTEFNEARRCLYKNAGSMIDVTFKTPEAVADEIIRIIKG
ncbi:shikimate kinase [Chitinophaga polysaccharea]|uniref:Shikimate kinase n=1 Tax=Chitinophaga polysaccharea TaxID=1293035 RepID=A0A561PQI4_9BACT|nr:shikimate kinase [Chitinophaga polysaccharea]TWF40321.1 shikimate kinase [Chitinophaga polysaccharea]